MHQSHPLPHPVASLDYSGGTFIYTFNAGEDRVCRDIEILDDAISEAPEEFEITLSTDDGAVVEVDPGTAVVEITDNDGKIFHVIIL